MTAEKIAETVAEAARKHSTVSISVETDSGKVSTEVEPYSILSRSRQLTLFCWDLHSNRVVNYPLSIVVGIEATGRPFNPRYEIEFR